MVKHLRPFAFGTAVVGMTPVILFAGASLATNIYSRRTGNLYAFGIGVGDAESGVHVDMLSPAAASAVLLCCAALLAWVWRATAERKREHAPTI